MQNGGIGSRKWLISSVCGGELFLAKNAKNAKGTFRVWDFRSGTKGFAPGSDG
jgi:hypothetical protein